MLEDCAELRGLVVDGLRETQSLARLLEGATRTEDVGGAAGRRGSWGEPPSGASTLGGGQR